MTDRIQTSVAPEADDGEILTIACSVSLARNIESIVTACGLSPSRASKDELGRARFLCNASPLAQAQLAVALHDAGLAASVEVTFLFVREVHAYNEALFWAQHRESAPLDDQGDIPAFLKRDR